MGGVFMAGPIKVRKLDSEVKLRIDKVIRRNLRILVGDANGVDRLIQEYLSEKAYRNVTVYCINNPRNNLGQWENHSIPVNEPRASFESYVLKDVEMANDADYGLMVWNGKSAGTLNNTLNLLASGKPIVVYFTPRREFREITTSGDFKALLSECNNDDIEKIDNKIRIRDRLDAMLQTPLNLE